MTGVPDGLALRLARGVLVVGPMGLRLLAWALPRAERAAVSGDGIMPPASFRALRAEVEAALSDYRAEDGEVPPAPALPSSTAPSGGVWASPVGTAEAGVILGCTARNVRDLCRRGVFTTAGVREGSWLMERRDVEARARGRGRASTSDGSGNGGQVAAGGTRR